MNLICDPWQPRVDIFLKIKKTIKKFKNKNVFDFRKFDEMQSKFSKKNSNMYKWFDKNAILQRKWKSFN